MRSFAIHLRPRRAFTAMELLIVLAIMSIIAVISMDYVGDYEASQRSDRAAKESLALFRYARNLAMTTGKKAKIDLATANTIAIYWQSNGSSYDATPVTTGSTASGYWKLQFGTSTTSRELIGTSMSVSPNTVTYLEYSALGNCTAKNASNATVSGNVTLTYTYGGKVKTITVAGVGDPTLN